MQSQESLKIESEFSKELDSLSDLISFGIAPVLLIYHQALYQIPTAGLTLTILFILCGAVRLARYNVKEFDGVFWGLPIIAAGICLALCFFLIPFVPLLLLAIFQSILMIMMVSSIKIAKM